MTSSIPLFWRLRPAKYRLTGTRCRKCEEVFFPPRSLCSKCRRSGEIEAIQFSGRGTILSHTIIRSPPEGFEKQKPYAVAIIRLDEGTNISGQVIGDISAIKTGKKVRTVFRKMSEDGPDGVISYALKFEIAE
jgi:uncharacterized OB-fold protein